MVPSKLISRNAKIAIHHAKPVTDQMLMTVHHAKKDYSSTKENVFQSAQKVSSETKRAENVNLAAILARPVQEAVATVLLANQDTSYT